jgi:pimeloyl-ACP methyl ester carboxylesterase
MHIYGISGLGADERVFEAVNEYLENPITYVPWLQPEPHETLAHYAERMAGTLDTQDPFILVGLSFGGMIASEMNKHVHPEKTIIISSCACADELPIYFRGVGRMNLVPYIPTRLMQLPPPLVEAVMSLKKQASKRLIHDIMEHTDREFLKWAVQAILTWDNTEVPDRLKRIHGRADLLLPLKVTADEILEGGHLVIVEEPRLIAEAIQRSFPDA